MLVVFNKNLRKSKSFRYSLIRELIYIKIGIVAENFLGSERNFALLSLAKLKKVIFRASLTISI
jgi:hypothetical protein